MNYLEEVAKRVKNTPQTLWFKERYTPIIKTWCKLIEDDIIKSCDIHHPLFDMLHTSLYTFRYEGNRYLLSVSIIGQVVDWYKLEKISPYSTSIRGTMVSSSDDDPNQESIMETLATVLNTKTPSELYNKLESMASSI